MTHGHSTGASSRSSSVTRALARAAGTWGGYQAWRQLDSDRRLELIEQALRTSDGLIDDFSLAL
jgi:hypothetical protein